MLAEKQENGSDVSEFGWALTVNETHPELVIFERLRVWVLRVVDNLVTEGCNAEDHGWVCNATVE